MTDKDEALARFRTRQLLQRVRENRKPEPEPCTDCSDADEDQPETAAAGRTVPKDIEIHGLAVPYDQPTGDGRMVRSNALTWNLDEGIPIIWDRQDGDHTGMTIGGVDALRADDSGVHVDAARLYATRDPEAAAAVLRVKELVAENALGWSVMLDDEEVQVMHREGEIIENPDGTVTARYSRGDDMSVITSARIRHLAIVDTPAFASARPVLGQAPINAAAAAVAVYPAKHFERWSSDELVPLRVEPDGRVWGHAAGEGCYRDGTGATCHRYSPDPDPKMKNFHTGTVALDNGSVVRAGSLTAAGLHATPMGTVEDQRRHHEDSTRVWAKVVAWDDMHGRLCVAGSVVPGLDPTFMAQVAGLPLSGEWWPVVGLNGRTLVGAHSVISPALPVGA